MWPRLSSTAIRLFVHSRLPCGIAAAYATTPTAPLRQRSVDDAEALQVELLMPDDGDGDGDPMIIGTSHSNYSSGGGTPSDGDAAAETITVVDAFARAKIANFVRRVTGEPPLAPLVRAVQSPGGTNPRDGDGLFHARVPLPVPPEYGPRCGEGLAPTAKEAELVAAMHAERVIDALGLPMFQLTSKQQRHAEAARAAGRWAPLSGDAPMPGTTPSPPRLHLVREGAALAGERRLGIDKMAFVSVTPGAFTPMRLTLASPFLLDHGSVFRIKQFFAAYDCAVPRHSRVTALHKPTNNIPNKGKSNYGKSEHSGVQVPDSEKMFVAQLKLPIDARFGERIGCGKAPVRRDAIALACMHAELIIDALGLALYPSSRERQAAHAAECRKVNRWCAEPGSSEYHYTRESPPALQMSHSGGDSANCATAAESGTGASLESLLLSHTAAIDSFDCVAEVPVLVPAARREFTDYLARYSGTAADKGSPFFIETLGITNHHTYRATATVPVPDLINASQSGHSVLADEVALSSFVAIGISTTEASAEIAASMHAIAALESLGRQIYDDDDMTTANPDRSPNLSDSTNTTPSGNKNGNSNKCEKSKRVCAALQPQRLTRATVLPPPCRFVRSHVGRVLVPGLTSPAWRAAELPAAKQLTDDIAQLRSARAKLPVADWSLAADAEGRIVIAPNVTAGEGRNYVHTLPAVRCPDAHALVRLRDFLERHGKRPESAIAVSCGETDDGLRRFAATAALPVPAAVGRRVVACGEAHTEEDARVMCAVHAELLLDALGVALYDHAGLQRKHCDAARLLGRWAPPPFLAYSQPPGALSQLIMDSSTDPIAVKEDAHDDAAQCDKALELPPPVRKEHSESCVWARLAKTAAAAQKNAMPSVATHTATSVASSSSSASASSASESSSSHAVPRPLQSIKDENQTGTGVGVIISDDELCDLSRLAPLHPSEIFRNAPRVMDQYCRRNGADLYRLMRQYSVLTPTHGRVHRALLEIPLPAAIGRRHAVAVAESKKEALALCCMHATLVLDSLGIAIYSDPIRQAAYAAAARARDRTTQSPGHTNTKERQTLGLKSLTSDTTDAPPAPPSPPSRTDCCRPHVWDFYVRACRAHIAKHTAHVLRCALFTERRAPRMGVSIEDCALDAVEALPLFAGARNALPRRCAAVGLPAPPALRYEAHGTPPHRRFLVEQQIVGTPFIARGAGDDGPEAVARAAMHYTYMLDAMAAVALGAVQPIALRGGRGGPHCVGSDPCGTARGALGVMALYAAACPPFQPLRATLRERAGPTFVALLEYDDASGLRMAGAGEAATVTGKAHSNVSSEGAASLARDRAALALCAQLQRHAAFQAVARVARASPALCAEAAALFVAEAQITASVAAALHNVESVAHGQSLWGNGAVALLRCDEGAAMDSSERQMLLDAARAHMTQSNNSNSNSNGKEKEKEKENENEKHSLSLRPPLLLPAAVRRLFAAMGLCGDDGQCSDFGAAAALLSTCVPMPTHSRGEDGGAMPLQLALLLLTGALSGCGPQAARAAAVALTAIPREGKPSTLIDDSEENSPLDERASAALAELTRRVAVLAGALQRAAPANPLGPLLAHAFRAELSVSDMSGSANSSPRLCLAVAAAAFPRVFVQYRACASGQRRAPLRSARGGAFANDSDSAMCVAFPSRLSELSAAHNKEHCALPLVVAFDAAAPNVLGVLIAPAALLLATALGGRLSLADDVPTVAVIDECVPVVTREPETLAALVRLRGEMRAHWAALRPIPPALQLAADDVFAAGHTLAHVAQAGLLLG